MYFRAVNSNKRHFAFKAQLPTTPYRCIQSPFSGACLSAVVELTAPQLSGKFRERDFVFMSKKCNKCQEFKPATSEYFHRDTNKKDGLYPRCKVCVNEYHQANKETIIKQVRRWQKANPDKVNEAARRYYKTEKARIYREENKEKASQVSKMSYRKRIEANPNYQREWLQRNPDKASINWARRRALKKQAEGSFTLEEWQKLCQDFGNKCLNCGEVKPLTFDHIIPLSKVGTNYIHNIQPLCKPCNSSKKDKTVDFRPFIPEWINQ